MTSISGEQSAISQESHRKKRRKIEGETSFASNQRNQSKNNQLRWRTSAEHQSYSTKLIAALREVRRRNPPPISDSLAVRDAADKVLAIAAKGRTRWSRAILTNRVKLRLKHHKKAKIRSRIPSPPRSTAALTAENLKSSPAPIEKRVKVLSRLVPGCRKVSFSNLLEETTDYIAALQMQVRTMSALAHLLSGSSTSAGSMDIEPANSFDFNEDNPVH